MIRNLKGGDIVGIRSGVEREWGLFDDYFEATWNVDFFHSTGALHA